MSELFMLILLLFPGYIVYVSLTYRTVVALESQWQVPPSISVPVALLYRNKRKPADGSNLASAPPLAEACSPGTQKGNR